MNNKKILTENHIYFLDYLRVISCFAIVILHTQNIFLVDNLGYMEEFAPTKIYLLKTSLQWAVPIFLMITGYIFLGLRNNLNYKNLSKYIIKFLLIIIFVNTIFNLIENYYYMKILNIDAIILAFKNMISGKSFDHMWYIHHILAIYLILPVIRPFFDKDIKDLYIFILISFIVIFVISFFNQLTNSNIFTIYKFDYMVFYVCLGGLLYKINFTKIKNSILIIILLICFLINIFTYLIFNTSITSYSNQLFAAIESTLIFIIAKNFNLNKNNFINYLSKYTLSIYIFHVFFGHLITKVFYIYPLNYGTFIPIFIFSIIIFFISFLFSFSIIFIKKLIIKFYFKRRK